MNENALLRGSTVLAALHEARITHVISVPDLGTSEGLLRPLANDSRIQLVRVCREEEGVGICCGLSFAAQRPVMLIQYTGFLASMNAIRAIAVEYRQPICLFVGTLSVDSPDDPSHSANIGVSRLQPVMDAIGIVHHLVSRDSYAALIAPALNAAFSTPAPVAFVLSRHPEAS